MHSVVAEAWVTLDTRLLGENVIVLALEVTHDLLETMCSGQWWKCTVKMSYARELIVNVITESRSVDDGQSNTDAILLEFFGCSVPVHVGVSKCGVTHRR